MAPTSAADRAELCSDSPPVVPTRLSGPRDILQRFAEPLRSRLPPEEARVLDALVALAADAGTTRHAHAPPAESPTLAPLLGATSWGDLRISLIDGHTVRVGCGKRAVRRTFADLGLSGRASREPTRKWEMLVAVCGGHGTFDWRAFGDFHAASQAMSVLRAKLRGAFGLGGDPFHDWDGRWRARFLASSEIGEQPRGVPA
jgi:hypothetical protein